MSGKVKKFCLRTSLVCLETLAVIACLVLLATVLFAWRLTRGPLDVDFARKYVEESLRDPNSGYGVILGNTQLHWPNLKGPIFLTLEKVEILKNDQAVLDIDALNLGLSGFYLLRGQVKPVTITLSRPELWLIRTPEGDIRLSMQDELLAEGQEGDVDTRSLIMRVVNRLSRPREEIDSRSPIDHLQTLEIKDARTVIEDYALGITWFLPDLDLTFARSDGGLVTMVDLQLPGGRDRAAHIHADIVYLLQEKSIKASFHVQDFNPHILSGKIKKLDWVNEHNVVVNGDIGVDLDENLGLQEVVLNLVSTNGTLGLKGVYDKPFPYDELSLSAQYNHVAGRLDVSDLTVKSHAISVSAKTTATITDEKITAPITLYIPGLPQESVVTLWPDVLHGMPIESWMTERLSEGRMHDATVQLALESVQKDGAWQATLKEISADFGIENMKVDYRTPLIPVSAAYGRGHFENDVITVELDRARLDDMEIAKSTITIDNVTADVIGTARVDLDMSGPLKTLFRYISLEPIDMGDALGVDILKVEGSAALNVAVSLPTSKDVRFDEVKVTAQGVLTNTVLPGIVKGMDVTGGPMSLKVSEGRVDLKGDVMLEGRPVTVEWTQALEAGKEGFSSRTVATLNADRELRESFGISLDGWLTGTFPLTVTYTEYDEKSADAVVSADIEQVELQVGPLDYTKKQGVRGTVNCTVVIENSFIREVTGLQVETPDFHMTDAKLGFETVNGESSLRRGKLPDVRLNETDISTDFEIIRGGLVKAQIEGPFFNARPFLERDKSKDGYTGPPFVVSLDVDRMRTRQARFVEKASVYIDMGGDGKINRLEMDAVAGEGAIYFRFKPDDTGKMTVRLEADDAGATLRAFKLYENVEGGSLVLFGEAKDAQNPDKLYGNAALKDFRVVNAPVLAQLLTIISPTGLLQLLGNDGIFFSKLESRFGWHIRKNGDLYIIDEGRTTGSSLGLTFEGEINKAKNNIRISGHIIPVSLLNTLVGNIPLVGTLLTGDSDAIFAATYEVKGDISKPEVSVNPLAILTPGILRTILFEGGSGGDREQD